MMAGLSALDSSIVRPSVPANSFSGIGSRSRLGPIVLFPLHGMNAPIRTRRRTPHAVRSGTLTRTPRRMPSNPLRLHRGRTAWSGPARGRTTGSDWPQYPRTATTASLAVRIPPYIRICSTPQCGAARGPPPMCASPRPSQSDGSRVEPLLIMLRDSETRLHVVAPCRTAGAVWMAKTRYEEPGSRKPGSWRDFVLRKRLAAAPGSPATTAQFPPGRWVTHAPISSVALSRPVSRGRM